MEFCLDCPICLMVCTRRALFLQVLIVVFSFAGDKLQIVTCLINQILTYATVRDIIDERGDKVKQLRTEVRAHQIAEVKKEREAAAVRYITTVLY
jgi:hypothetical protein